jgi:hypothetical protein
MDRMVVVPESMRRRSGPSEVIVSTRQPGMGQSSFIPVLWAPLSQRPNVGARPTRTTQSAGDPRKRWKITRCCPYRRVDELA